MWHGLLHFLGLDSASGTAYLAWSGIVGDAALLGAAVALWRRWTCHTWWCPRHSHYDFTDAATGLTFKLCRRCHPAHHGKRLTRNHIASIHRRNQAARTNKRLAPRTPARPGGGPCMNVSKLSIDGSGRVSGICPNGQKVKWNDPWPCRNGTSGGMGPKSAIRGMIDHTMVGNLPGTQQVFNQGGFDASAHFLVDQEGQIVSMGPFGPGLWKAWAEAAGNFSWFSVESADDGNPNNPYTLPQLWALAQLLELASRPAVGNFPMQITNSTAGLGLGTHNMGGSAWGGHSCPDLPPRHVRSNQRGQIIDFAKQLRGSGPGHKPPPPKPFKLWTAEGMLPLAALASNLRTSTPVMIAMTAEHSDHAVFGAQMTEYLSAVFAADHADMGPGLVWHYPKGRADLEWTTSPGNQPLSGLAVQLGTSVPAMLQMTAERSPDGAFQGAVARYVTGVMARSQIHVPHGTVLAYP